MEIDPLNFRTQDHKIGRTLTHGGKTYLFFGGTAYLGLNSHPDIIHLYKEGLDRYGTNVGTSRNNNVQFGIYDEAEKNVAERFGYADSLVVSSGFLASQLAIRTLTQDMNVYFAPNAHPALWLDQQQKNPALPFETWAAQTAEQINQSEQKHVVIASDTFASIRPACYDFSVFSKIDDRKEVYFLLDDSHGFGVFQNPTIAYLQKLNRPNFHFVTVGSLAKGLGVDAGILLGDTETIAQLRKTAVFAGASPPSPAAMYVLCKSSTIQHIQLEKLQERMAWFEEGLRIACQTVAGFPVYCFDDPSLYHRLLEEGIVISSFPYPNPSAPPLNRVVINSLHQQEDILRLTDVINASTS